MSSKTNRIHVSARLYGGISAIVSITLANSIPDAVAQSTPTMIGDSVTIRSFNNPSGSTVRVVDPGIEYDVTGSLQRDEVDIAERTILAKIYPSTSLQFLGATSGDVFEITGIDDRNDPENSVIVGARFITATDYRGVTATNLQFSDSRGVDSGTIRFELEGIFNHPGFSFSALWPRWTVEVTFERLPPPMILSSEVDLEQGRITVTWAAAAGNTYDIFFSTDLKEWTKVVRGHRSLRTQSTTEFPIPLGGERRGFFRVEEVLE